MEERVKAVLDELHDDSNVFYLIGDSELKKIAAYLTEATFPAGSLIFREGDPADYVAFIARGKVGAKKQTEFHGGGIIMAHMSRGSVLGELSFSDERPRSASAEALEETELLILSRAALDKISEEHPEIAAKIYKGFCRALSLRLRKLTERLAVVF